MRVRQASFVAVFAVGLLNGCAPPAQSANARVPESDEEPRSTALLSAAIPKAVAKPEPEAIPTVCVGEQAIKDAKACVPPGAFAKKLCGGIYPEVALAMFAKGTPWTRIWLAGDVEAWNASGGLTHRAKLTFDEEVLVLSRHGNGGSIVTTGSKASFDVLRFDGTCVSVMEGELTTRRPPAPKPASVPWGRLEETTRRALLTSPKVKATLETVDKSCGSGSSDKRTCEKADKAFTNAVAEFVRSGGPLPTPTHRP